MWIPGGRHCYTLLKIQYHHGAGVNSCWAPCSIGALVRGKVTRKASHGVTQRGTALGHRASKVCHVIFADVIGWPGAAKHLEHQWTCHRVPLCTGPMRPKIHRYPRHSWLMWRTCSQELAHHILSPWVLAREPWTQLCSDQHQPLSKKLKTERNYVVVFDYCHRFSGVGQSWWSMYWLCIHDILVMCSSCTHCIHYVFI